MIKLSDDLIIILLAGNVNVLFIIVSYQLLYTYLGFENVLNDEHYDNLFTYLVYLCTVDIFMSSFICIFQFLNVILPAYHIS